MPGEEASVCFSPDWGPSQHCLIVWLGGRPADTLSLALLRDMYRDPLQIRSEREQCCLDVASANSPAPLDGGGCEAAHKSVIKKVEVYVVVKIKEGAVAKQVVLRTLKTGISPPLSPGRSQKLPDPNPNSSIYKTVRQVSYF